MIDADLPRRLATELRNRKREAVNLYELGLSHNVLDPDMLQALAEEYRGDRNWTLVTGDDTMPAEHGPVLTEIGATVATIHPEYPKGLTEDAWRRDITHRWAHAMQLQERGTVRRYGANGSRLWRPRRRHLRRIAEEGWTPWRVDAGRRGAAAPNAAVPDPLPGIDWQS